MPMPVLARHIARILLFVLVAGPGASRAAAQSVGWRTVEFQTTQVTAPDVAASPDGQWLIFTMLGKLFRLPAAGGEAEQLTSGPFYDNDPAISPDGQLIAFQSDRDGSEGNIFVLTLASREIRQLTHEAWADRPVWSPDGQSLVYLQLAERPGAMNTLSFVLSPASAPAVTVRRIRLAGGNPETLHALRGYVRSPFILADGRVGWAVLTRDSTAVQWKTRIEIRALDGQVSTWRVFDGAADPVVAVTSPAGLVARVADGIYPRDFSHRIDVLFAPLATGADRHLATISGETAGFAVASGRVLYVGNRGRLWKFTPSGRRREVVPLRARISLVVREPTAPPRWSPVEPGTSAPPRTIRFPRLSPDGSRIVFQAAGDLWQQPVTGGPARRVLAGGGSAVDVAFSPDGHQLAFLRDAPGTRDIRVMDLQSGESRTVAPAGECAYEYLTWSAHGDLVVTLGGRCRHQVIAINPGNGTRRVLAETSDWEPYPQLSADGWTLFFQASFPGSAPSLYRLRLDTPGPPEPILPAGGDGMNMVTHGQWVAQPIPNRLGIRLSTLGVESLASARERVLTELDGADFSFAPDGSALLYVAGGKLWRQPLPGGAAQEIPIQLRLLAPTPPPTLLERVRVLDFAAGGFGAETSLLLEGGRIRWIGSARGRQLPRGTVTLDAAGRFAIPGLFDMHGHLDWCGRPAYFAFGITSMRNMGGRLAEQNAQADQGDFTGTATPRCFYAGRIFEGPQGRNDDGLFIHVSDTVEARRLVRLCKAQGAQFIKLYERLSWPLQRAAADEAWQVGLPVAAHGITVEQVVKGVTLGYTSLSHWERFYDDALQMFAATGIRWDPNLAGRSGVEVVRRNEPERFPASTNPSVFAPFGDVGLIGAWFEMLRTTRAAYHRGITMLPGTDGGADLLHWELEFLTEAGIPPLDVLRFATQAAAATVGTQEHLGSIEAGKLADLILLDRNPLEDIRNTLAIWRVFKGGWVFDPTLLRP